MRSLTPKDIGALAREARIGASLTQAQLGAKIGASRYWVAEFERGNPGAELGLALKALRVLKLVLIIEHRDVMIRREHDAAAPNTTTTLQQPVIDLGAILSRSATPAPSPDADPFRIHNWKASPPDQSPPSTPRAATRPRRRKRGR